MKTLIIQGEKDVKIFPLHNCVIETNENAKHFSIYFTEQIKVKLKVSHFDKVLNFLLKNEDSILVIESPLNL